MAQRRRNEQEKVEAFSHFSLILPLDQCAEMALEVVEKDAMGNWYTGAMNLGFCILDFTPRPGVVEFIIVEELEGEKALAAVEVVLSPKEAARFLQRFGHVYRLHLQSGKMLIYLAGFNHEDSHLYWEPGADASSSSDQTPTKARVSRHHKSLPARPGARKTTRKGKAS